MQILNTLNNKHYDNEYLFLTPTKYGIDDLIAIASKDGQADQAIEHALDELHNRGITRFSQLLTFCSYDRNLKGNIDKIKRRINDIQFEQCEQERFPQSLNYQEN